MAASVVGQLLTIAEGVTTTIARVWLSGAMCVHMVMKLGTCWKLFATYMTHVTVMSMDVSTEEMLEDNFLTYTTCDLVPMAGSRMDRHISDIFQQSLL